MDRIRIPPHHCMRSLFSTGIERLYFSNNQWRSNPPIVLVGQQIEHVLVGRSVEKIKSHTMVERDFFEWNDPQCKKSKYELS